MPGATTMEPGAEVNSGELPVPEPTVTLRVTVAPRASRTTTDDVPADAPLT